MKNDLRSDVASDNPPRDSFTRLLVGVDFSDETTHVLRTVFSFASRLEVKIFFCYVSLVNTSVIGNESDGHPSSKDEFNKLEKLRELVHEQIDEEGAVEFKILHGDPAERICEYAEYLGCDLIVLGSRGQSGLKKALMGSVSSSVANKSKISVLIIR
jgi:nucleotide-binding universal stress UspA family protein